MKKVLSLLTLLTVLALSSFAIAAQQVVVIPLNTTKSINAEGKTYSCIVSINDGSFDGTCNFSTIPAGQNFVAEFISGNFWVPLGQELFVRLLHGFSGGSIEKHSLFFRKQSLAPNGAQNIFIISQPVTFYLSETENLGISIGRSLNTGNANGEFFLTGYLVPKN